ncbi:hypothetical protein [Microbacterium dauci]|uniref:Uncharacterized protein n=1 Tax=Microbacterium dauci TaxID=3048008 RepID=A0ABT6ZCB7_9MICO|nr:hypothetical protein [Microbacterium sp. LX3-4]MDJ1113799.1 hypothetical protein [Microbacterium sp. LX3-4]
MEIRLVGGPLDGQIVAAQPEGYILINVEHFERPDQNDLTLLHEESRHIAVYAPVAALIERSGGDVIQRELIDADAHLSKVLRARGIAGPVKVINQSDGELVDAWTRVKEADRRYTEWLDANFSD